MVSATYPGGAPRRDTFAREAAAAQETAARICAEVEKYGDTDVSFYVFGNRDNLRPLSGDTLDMDPGRARARLGELFDTRPATFDQDYTYIAYSIFQLVKRELGLPQSFGPKDDIPEDAKLLNVFVFTDGDEDFDSHFDNSPYSEWLRRNERRLQIRWQIWRLFPRTDAERAARDAQFAPPAADRVEYSVHFGVPSVAYSFSTQEPPADRTVDLEVPRLVRLVPSLTGGEALAATAGGAACTAATLGPVQAAPATRLLVQSGIEWPSHAAATPEWAISAPAREVVETISPMGLPQRQFARGVLRLLIERPTRAVIEPIGAAGSYAVRLNQKELCDELQRAYPNSTFVFPSTGRDAIPPLGYVQVDNMPTFTFVLATREAVRPNDSLPALVADRFRRYRQASRTFRVTAPKQLQGAIEATVLVRRGGATLQSPQIVSLTGARRSGGSISVPFGDWFTLALPAEPQSAWKRILHLGFDEQPGDYELTLRIRPRIASAPPPPWKIRFQCENCDPARVRTDGQELAISMPFRIGAIPMSWLEILGIALLIIFIAWALVQWWTRPQFERGFVIGTIEGGYADLRDAHGSGLRGKLALFWRRPVYVELMPGGKTVVYRDPFIDRTPPPPGNTAAVRRERNIVGVRPDDDRILMWCVAATHGATLEVKGRRLDRTDAVPSMGDKRLVQLRYKDTPANLEVRGEQSTTYQIQRLQPAKVRRPTGGRQWAS